MGRALKLVSIVAILFLGLSNPIKAQVYTIQSFDGGIEKIRISTDDIHRRINISYLNDSIYLPNFNNMVAIKVLLNHFLSIDYEQRSGTGMHLQHTLILCVNHKKLIQSLHITSLFNEEFIDFRKPDATNLVDVKTVYELKLNLVNDKTLGYKLKVSIHDEKWSKHNKKTDHNKNDDIVLQFDKSQNIFYTKTESVNHNFDMYDPQTEHGLKKIISGKYTTVVLGKSHYYFIKGEWYENSDNKNLVRYSYQ